MYMSESTYTYICTCTYYNRTVQKKRQFCFPTTNHSHTHTHNRLDTTPPPIHMRTLQHTTTHLSAHIDISFGSDPLPQHTATHCNTLQRTSVRTLTSALAPSSSSAISVPSALLLPKIAECNGVSWSCAIINTLCVSHTATRCNTLQHIATHCNAVALDSQVQWSLVVLCTHTHVMFCGYTLGSFADVYVCCVDM